MAKEIYKIVSIFLCLTVPLCENHMATNTRYLPSLSSSSAPSPWLSSSSLTSTLLSNSDSERAENTKSQMSPSRTPHLRGSKMLQKDLKRLSRLLPGVYSNMEQYQQDAERALPYQQRHVLLRSSYRPVALTFLPRAFAVLVQDYSSDSLFPYRQRVHTFSSDPAYGAIRMKVWDFATKRAEKKATRNLKHMSRLRRKDLLSRGSCDMFWRRLDTFTFLGITGQQCLGYVRGEQVRIRVSMTLTREVLQTKEGWYRIRDGKKLVHSDVPYNLLRTKSFTGSRYAYVSGIKHSKIHRSTTSHEKAATPRQSNLISAPSLTLQNPDYRTATHIRTTTHPRTRASNHLLVAFAGNVNTTVFPKTDTRKGKDQGRDWLLRDYEAVSMALLSGHLVFYSVELSACSLPTQFKPERLSFGDFVDSFESTPSKMNKELASIRFWQSKFVQGDDGMEAITREISIKSNGHVQVRLHRKYVDTNKLVWDQSAHCRLFDPQTGIGGVKMTSQPAENVREITTFGKFRSSLRRGRRQVRMIIDLTQCEGRTRSVTNIIGTTVRAYDFINGGSAIEVSQLTPDTEHVYHSLLTGHFLRNGEVVFITSLQPQAGSIVDVYTPMLHQASTFRCALAGSGITNSNGPWGVRLFFSM